MSELEHFLHREQRLRLCAFKSICSLNNAYLLATERSHSSSVKSHLPDDLLMDPGS